ncbi:hypothetical protein BV898_14838 [Hypsibius exemplaris]|uniref:Uncharacterized protein n=1 Tax=Hypsibius exemplaris TaxID=2072580 RepID=A0A9X6NCW7_HYPEX|nr:hypothetical protein BV898_14838 [Hypsibius exemplaris]
MSRGILTELGVLSLIVTFVALKGLTVVRGGDVVHGRQPRLVTKQHCTLAENCQLAAQDLDAVLGGDAFHLDSFDHLCSVLGRSLPCFRDGFTRCPEQIQLLYSWYSAYRIAESLERLLCQKEEKPRMAAMKYVDCHNEQEWMTCQNSTKTNKTDNVVKDQCLHLVRRDDCYRPYIYQYCSADAIVHYENIHDIYFASMSCSTGEGSIGKGWLIMLISGLVLTAALLAIIMIYCRMRRKS